MSRQSEAKEKQGYVPKYEPDTCGSCAHMTSERALPKWMAEANSKSPNLLRYPIGTYGVESNIRCGIGYFAVKKGGTCNEFKPKK